MKALNFVIGMIVGMVLLVVAVVGAVFAAGSLVSVGQIENTLGTDIFDDESDVNNKTILELVQSLIGDLQNMDELTIEKLRTDYGLKIPTEISGIDITPLFGYSLLEVPDHLGDVVNNMTLRDVGEFLDMDFETEYPDLRVLQDNLDEKVNVALDNVLSSIDDEKMTVYTIERDFGLSLGENNLITTLRHTPLSSFAEVMDNLPVGVVIDADSDLFVEKGAVRLYVVADDYIEVPAGELTSPLADGTRVTETYIAGADENGLVYREMRYVMNDDGTYEPDNSCYASSFDAEANTETYYRHIVYTAYDSSANYGSDAVFAVKTFLNDYVSDGAGGFVLADGGFLTLDTVYADTDGTTLNARILSDPSLVKNGEIGFATVPVFASVTADDGTVSVEPAAEYGRDPEAVLDDNTRLDDNFTGYLRVHAGTADPPAQVIAGETISTIAGATDALTSLKLGEVLDIDEDSAKILQTLKDTPINKMSDALDTITLADATDIVMSEYTMADNGSYVFVANDGPVGGEAVMDGEKYLGYFTLYNPAVHTGENIKRYDRTVSDGDASVALQRLAGTTIPNISKAFSGMVLGDALNVDVDTFAPVSDPQPGETYYVFKEKLGYPERVVYDAETAEPGVTYYERTHEGEGNAVLKQLAYVKIDNVSEAMDGIIENTLLSDIIEVTEYTVAAYNSDQTSSENDQWLFEADPNYTENGKHYTFVYDGSGKYYMTDVTYLPATESQLADETVIHFTYAPNTEFESVPALLSERSSNIYFASTENGKTVYKTNPALLAYYISRNDIAALQKSFSRVQDENGEYSVDVYTNVSSAQAQGGLYVKDEGSVTGSAESGFSVTFGGYSLYDAENPAHWGAELYFKHSEGYYPASDGNGTHSFDFTTGSFSERTGGGYILLEAKYEDGRTGSDGSTPLKLYYYSLIDSEYKEGYTVYSKRECDYIYIENGTDGKWTNVSGEWEEYNEDIHGTDAARYDRVIGYIGGNAANNGGTGLSPLSKTKVTVIEEKSPTILISLLERQVTIGSLNETIDTLTIGEMMEIEPGSVFDNPALSGSTVDGLSANVNSMFTDMTIGTLLKYANIAVSPQVSYILQDVKLADFFGALKYSDGQLTVNMEKLFGIA